MAADRIRVGEADVMIAGGAEIDEHGADDGQQAVVEPRRSSTRDENVGIAYGMGLTAEKVARAMEGQPRGAGRVRARVAPAALAAQQAGEFKDEIDADRRHRPLPRSRHRRAAHARRARSTLDEGPRPDTSLEGLAKLRPVFAAKGSGHRRQQLADVATAPAR